MRDLSLAATPHVAASEAGTQTARVLVVRSCRPAEFARAVSFVRDQAHDVEVVALSHRGHRDSLRAAGVDRIVEIPGRRFGVFRLSPRCILELKRQRFAQIVIPQMTREAFPHVNLYWLALTIGAQSVTVLPGSGVPLVFSRVALLRYACVHTAEMLLQKLDVPVVLLLLAFSAILWRRAQRTNGTAKRRVLHVISHLGVGGAQRQLAAVVNATPPDSYEVDVIAFTEADGDFARQWFSRSDVEVSHVGGWPRMRPIVLEIARRCRARQYDVVHTWLFFGNVVGVAAARLAGVPRVVASVRNLSLWKRTWYRQWWFRTADVLVARAADVVTVNAHALAADHARWSLARRSRIEVVHNGLDPSQFDGDRPSARRELHQLTGTSAEAVFVGTNGRLAVEKNQCEFLRLVQHARQQHHTVHALIIGDGPLRSELEAQARALALERAVTFVGERRDAPELMAGLDAFVLTSTIEGFPNALLEAVFLGVPAIASDVGGCLDVLGSQELVYAAGDHAAGAQRLCELLANPHRARARAKAVRQRALRMFTAEHTTAAWLALYAPRHDGSRGHTEGAMHWTDTKVTTGLPFLF